MRVLLKVKTRLEELEVAHRERARQAGIETEIGNHFLRASGVTDYLRSGGTLEKAESMANHSSPRTAKLYDRRSEGSAVFQKTVGQI